MALGNVSNAGTIAHSQVLDINKILYAGTELQETNVARKAIVATEVNNVRLLMIIDTGAAFSVLSGSLWRRIRNECVKNNSEMPELDRKNLVNLHAAQGGVLHIIVSIKLALKLVGETILHNIFVVENLAESIFLLCYGFLEDNDINIITTKRLLQGPKGTTKIIVISTVSTNPNEKINTKSSTNRRNTRSKEPQRNDIDYIYENYCVKPNVVIIGENKLRYLKNNKEKKIKRISEKCSLRHNDLHCTKCNYPISNQYANERVVVNESFNLYVKSKIRLCYFVNAIEPYYHYALLCRSALERRSCSLLYKAVCEARTLLFTVNSESFIACFNKERNYYKIYYGSKKLTCRIIW